MVVKLSPSNCKNSVVAVLNSLWYHRRYWEFIRYGVTLKCIFFHQKFSRLQSSFNNDDKSAPSTFIMKLSPALLTLVLLPPSQGFTTPQTHLSPRSLPLFSTATPTPTQLTDQEILAELEAAAESIASDALEDVDCIVDPTTGGPADELCSDESLYFGVKRRMKSIVRGTLGLLRSTDSGSEEVDTKVESYLFGAEDDDDGVVPEGELLEEGWTKRGNSSALRRNAEVWKFAFKSVFKVLGARKLRKAGDEEGAVKAEGEAALFIRDGLLRLGPTFVKLGQVVSTRTDVLPKTYTDGEVSH
jgi:hypothetical protein